MNNTDRGTAKEKESARPVQQVAGGATQTAQKELTVPYTGEGAGEDENEGNGDVLLTMQEVEARIEEEEDEISRDPRWTGTFACQWMVTARHEGESPCTF